ncbi:MAG: hypothetical protein JNM69_43040 [Archangium sp.]|nr:hypothetical protein [Archangium sp.]
MKRLLGWICCASLFVVGCECNVVVPEDVDGGVDAGFAGGTSGTGGGSTAGGAAGGSTTAGGAAGGSMTAGGAAGGSTTAGGTAGGAIGGGDAGGMAGGDAGGSATAGGTAGGAIGGGTAGGLVIGGGTAGGLVIGGGTAGGLVIGGGTAGGLVIGGGTAGGSIGGGTAGGSIGGGAAGGSIGGGTAGGSGGPVDTYVCVSCAGSADTNTGAQNSPFRTIGRGIAVAQLLGRPTVFVGSANGVATTYAENLVIPAGVVVQGRWVVNGAFSWSRTGNRTNLLNLFASGVTFAAGAGRSSGLDGLLVRSSGAVAGATAVAAISIIDASPTILDVQVEVPSAALPPPTTAAGIAVSTSGSPTSVAFPRIAGVSTGNRSVVTAGPATTNSIGISVSGASAELEFVNATGGNTSGATAVSVGVFLSNGRGTTIRSSTLASGLASQGACAGLSSTGDSAGVVVDTVEARGCTGVPNGLNPPNASVGVSFSSCPAIAPGSTAPRLTGSVVQGGVAQGTSSYVAGVISNDGCALNIDNNNVTGSNAVVIVPQTAAGVLCTHELVNGTAGRNAPCRVANNRSITAGRGQAASVGLACIGNCASGTASCAGSCSEVMSNTAISGQDSRLVVHGLITQSSPRLARNTFGGDTNSCSNQGSGSPALFGLRLEGSASRVENNLVQGGTCSAVTAFEQVNAQRTGDLSIPAPDVHSNTFVPVAGLSGGTMNQLIVGVAIRSALPSIMVSQPRGSYRNNIITALGLANVRFAFVEGDSTTDPAVLENNDFWTGPSITGMAPLYQNEGTTTLNSAGQINALNGGGVSSQNNLSNDPVFGLNFRLTALSPMRGAGTAAGAPGDDIDGDRRPSPTNTTPDIGCDEVQ